MAGSVTVTDYALGNIHVLSCACVADAAAATFPDTVLPRVEGILWDLETDPGAPAPTDDYNVTVVDACGHDVLESVGLTLDTVNTEKAPIVYGQTATHPSVDATDVLTLKIAGNAVLSAATLIKIYIWGATTA